MIRRISKLIPVILALASLAAASSAAEAGGETKHELFLAVGTLYNSVGSFPFCPDDGSCSQPDYTFTALRLETQIRKKPYYVSTGVSLSRAAHYLEGAAGFGVPAGELWSLHWGAGPTLMWHTAHSETSAGNVTDLGLLPESKLTFGLDLRLHLRGALRFVRGEPASGEFTVGFGGG